MQRTKRNPLEIIQEKVNNLKPKDRETAAEYSIAILSVFMTELAVKGLVDFNTAQGVAEEIFSNK